MTAGLAELRSTIDARLGSLQLPIEPTNLYDPVRYVLSGGGKRFRPTLLLLIARIAGTSMERAMPAALAIEIFHNFTLVHDDIMDRADTRRGRATIHSKWDEPTAILSGDLMMGLSYDFLAQLETNNLAEIIRSFHTMVARLCEGQTLDMDFERRADVTVDQYIEMIDRKTGALVECAAEIACLIDGGRELIPAVTKMSRSLGRAFQVQDDLMDLIATDAKWGKRVGSDLMEAKKTYLLLRQMELKGASNSIFAPLMSGKGMDPADIDQARTRMEESGVLEDARRFVEQEYDSARTRLEALDDGPGKPQLLELIDGLLERAH